GRLGRLRLGAFAGFQPDGGEQTYARGLAAPDNGGNAHRAGLPAAIGVVSGTPADVDRRLADPDVAVDDRARRGRDMLCPGIQHRVIRVVDAELDRAPAGDGHRKPPDGIGAVEALHVTFRTTRADGDAN